MQGPTIPTTSPTKKIKNTVAVSAQIPFNLAERLHTQVEKEERTQGTVVRRAIECYLEKEGA